MHDIVLRLLGNNPPVEEIAFFDAGNLQHLSSYSLREETRQEFQLPAKATIDSLKEFLSSDYQKIEVSRQENKLAMYFLTGFSGQYILVRIITKPDLFIQQYLRPEIQQVARELFYIQVQQPGSDSILYASDETLADSGTLQYATLWYLPGYQLGISQLKTKTINEMVIERHQKENYVLWALILVVLAGAFFLFRSIRNEIRLAEMKSEFVSNVSHEIRTPLASISMYAETLLLKRVKNEERKEEYLKTIHTETQRLSEMVNRILSFSRMEKNKRKFVFEPYQPEPADFGSNEIVRGSVSEKRY